MPKKPTTVIEDIPTEADIAKGDETLKKMLQTKPRPHKDMVGKAGKNDKREPTK